MTMLHAGNGGMCYIDSVELDEVYTPLRVHTRRLIEDSEGAGRFRGAPGIRVELGPVNCRMEAGFVADGNIHIPLGARNGGPASRSDQFRLTVNGELQRLEQCSQSMDRGWRSAWSQLVVVAEAMVTLNHVIRSVSYKMFEKDIVSRNRAEEVYGIVIDRKYGNRQNCYTIIESLRIYIGRIK